MVKRKQIEKYYLLKKSPIGGMISDVRFLIYQFGDGIRDWWKQKYNGRMSEAQVVQTRHSRGPALRDKSLSNLLP